MIPILLLCAGVVATGLCAYCYFRSLRFTQDAGDESRMSGVTDDAGTEQGPIENLPDSSVAKIGVSQRGEVTLNGKPASLNQLDNELDRLKQIGGVVWYHRESSGGRASEAAMAVFARIGSARLPIKLFADAEFKHPVP